MEVNARPNIWTVLPGLVALITVTWRALQRKMLDPNARGYDLVHLGWGLVNDLSGNSNVHSWWRIPDPGNDRPLSICEEMGVLC